MPGRPKLRALAAKLTDLAAAVGAAGPEEVLFDRIAAGESVTAICRELGCSTGLLYSWISGDERRREALAEARKVAAAGLVDEARELVGRLGESAPSEKVAAINARVKFNTWLSSVFDRATFGNAPPTVTVQLNVGALHLQALERAKMPAPELPAVVEATVEVVAEATEPSEVEDEDAPSADPPAADTPAP